MGSRSAVAVCCDKTMIDFVFPEMPLLMITFMQTAKLINFVLQVEHKS
jgi:hypothetical protein